MSNEYIEMNLGRASFLVTQDFEFKRFIRIGRNKLAFVFVDSNGRAAEVAESFSNGASAPAEQLLDNFGDLKRKMYATKDELHDEVKDVPSNKSRR